MIKCKIIGKNNNQEYNVSEGAVITENYNETLDSGTIIIPHLSSELEIEPFDIVKISTTNDSKYKIDTKFMCVDTYTCTQTSLDPAIYQYEIKLCSLTKLLEGILLPSLSITRLKVGSRRDVWYYLNQYLNEYGTKTNANAHDGFTSPLFYYGNGLSYQQTESVQAFFEYTECPELQWNEPTLREVITSLMMVKDCIPVVHYNELASKLIIDYMNISITDLDITETQRKGINYIQTSQSSTDYVSEIKTKMVNSVGEGETTNICEDITFRNPESYIMSTENVMVETSLPIWKLKKVQVIGYVQTYVSMYDDYNGDWVGGENFSYGGFVTLFDENDNDDTNKFVLEKGEWQLKNIKYGGPYALDNTYQNTCLYYVRGDKGIHNFNNKVDYKVFWVSGQQSVLEMVQGMFGNEAYTRGLYSGYEEALEAAKQHLESIYTTQGSPSFVVDWENTTHPDWKEMMFRVEYEALGEHTIFASKSPFVRNKRQIIDNQTESYANIRHLGMLEYMKAKRLGNQLKLINARYKLNENQMPRLAQKINGSIIFSKQIAVNDNFIKANYQTTKDYVLRDYFTGIKSKLRSWKIVSGEEAFVRADVLKFYVSQKIKSADDTYMIPNYLEKYDSTKQYYVDDYCVYGGRRYICLSGTTGTFNPSHWDATGESGGTLQDYINNFKYCCVKFTTSEGNKPNGTDIQWNGNSTNASMYMVEFQKAICGNSAIFTIKMRDNTLVGTYVTDNDYRYDPNDSSLRGKAQKTCPYTDKNGEITGGTIYFYSTFNEGISYGTNAKEKASNILPAVENSQLRGLLCEIPFTLHKDNKEILQITIQIEKNDDADDMFLGKR